MKIPTLSAALACGLAVAAAIGQPRGPSAEARGELLYTTYCVACHTRHVHWREQRLAGDWAGLTRQVRRWEHNGNLGLSEDDIAAIARYLNRLYYHFPVTGEKQIGAASAPRTAAQN